jgi:hypothetical protein
MEVIGAIIGLLVLIGYFIQIENVKKIRNKQDAIYMLLAEQNNLMSQQLDLFKDHYRSKEQEA